MRWASTLSRQTDTCVAFGEAASVLEQQLAGNAPDFLIAFASPEHADDIRRIPALAARRFPRAFLAGCVGSGVIGDAREAEQGPAFSLTAAVLPGVRLSGLRDEPAPPAPAHPGAAASWRDRVGLPPEARPKFLLLADPHTADVVGLIEGLDREYPEAPKFGGLAGGHDRRGTRLLLGEDLHRGGAIGVVFSGDLSVDTLVAQGCRPIGEPMLITRCRRTMLQELDGRPPLHAIAELYGTLDVRDRDLLQHSLFLGLEMRSDAIEYQPGELLVRNILGADEVTGSLVVGAELRPMTVARFVLRDPHSAEQELRSMLASHRRAVGRPAGALLFSCVGRGEGLFGHPDHDTSLFEEQLGPAPLGGFFCHGEIGPVGGTTFLHGYTSAFAMFREVR